MGQKVNPHGLRVGVIKDWDSRWYAPKSEFGDLLVQDYKIREYIKKKLFAAGIPKVEIERSASNSVIKITVHCAKPGIVIGRGGEAIDVLRKEIEKMTGKTVRVEIEAEKNPSINAQLVAERIADDLERRSSFRRAMKNAMSNAMKLGAGGIKTRVSGRLNGAEIARSESYREGTIPLQTIRADIDYGTAEANTTYGIIGVKVWIYKGDILKGDINKSKTARLAEKRERPRRDTRPRDKDGKPINRRPYNQNRTGGYQGGQTGGYQGGQNQGGQSGQYQNRQSGQYQGRPQNANNGNNAAANNSNSNNGGMNNVTS
jgi:small subunit ribosomal protein S3